MDTRYLVLVVAFFICLFIRTGYEMLKEAGRVNPEDKLIFAFIFTSMCALWVCWFSLCPFGFARCPIAGDRTLDWFRIIRSRAHPRTRSSRTTERVGKHRSSCNNRVVRKAQASNVHRFHSLDSRLVCLSRCHRESGPGIDRNRECAVPEESRRSETRKPVRRDLPRVSTVDLVLEAMKYDPAWDGA
jgi:hypothetical protein